jgi:hypothetical protein
MVGRYTGVEAGMWAAAREKPNAQASPASGPDRPNIYYRPINVYAAHGPVRLAGTEITQQLSSTRMASTTASCRL